MRPWWRHSRTGRCRAQDGGQRTEDGQPALGAPSASPAVSSPTHAAGMRGWGGGLVTPVDDADGAACAAWRTAFCAVGLTEVGSGVRLVGKMAKRSILKPDAFRLLPQ